ncbi:MAG: primase-helicase zinc-binding domain-containing protein [Parachlamydiales bacterium]
MNLLDLAQEMGFDSRKTSTSRGGEYHCPCPVCGGNDRFMFWPEENRYWCRQCGAGGDAIQFCRDFQKLSFRDACIKVQKSPEPDKFRSKMRHVDLIAIRTPSRSWEDIALEFIESSMQRLLLDEEAMELILQRGLSLDTIRGNHLGWNPVKAFYRRSDWGIEETEERKWVCLPAGIVIPIFEGSAIRKLKIRKSEWKEGDFYGKYYEVPGSSNIIPTFGVPSRDVVVVVEAEFDAMLVTQEAGDLCACVALGGAQKRPHSSLHQLLMSRKLILFALDFDEAGKKEYSYWQQFYPNLEPWPVPEGKSPGDYFQAGGKIRDWVSAGIFNSH